METRRQNPSKSSAVSHSNHHSGKRFSSLPKTLSVNEFWFGKECLPWARLMQVREAPIVDTGSQLKLQTYTRIDQLGRQYDHFCFLSLLSNHGYHSNLPNLEVRAPGASASICKMRYTTKSRLKLTWVWNGQQRLKWRQLESVQLNLGSANWRPIRHETMVYFELNKGISWVLLEYIDNFVKFEF